MRPALTLRSTWIACQAFCVATSLIVALQPTMLRAQVGVGLVRQPAVGGVAIDAQGVLQAASLVDLETARQQLRQELTPVPADAVSSTSLRKVSLRQLETALQQSLEDGSEIPDAVRFLAGMQRVEYVFLFPESGDIVLAGPGEGWTINDAGIAVGQTSGRPVLLLDDLLVALRSTDAARLGGITCSIDPQPAGLAAMQQYMRRQRQFHGQVTSELEQLMGPQQIAVQGVPEDSHFARVLVAADYRMKRIAMQLDPSPLRELPSYMQMLQESRVRVGSATPRWWMACNYDAIGRAADGLSWQIRGQGVKTLTETEVVDGQGRREGTGRTSPLAQRWADAMTTHYDQLSAEDSIFGQLRNVMDLCVVAALLEKEQAYARTGCDLPVLRSAGGVPHERWYAAKQVATTCSVVKRGRDFIISASGGVQIGSWQVLDTTVEIPELADLRTAAQAQPTAGNWWWN